MQAAFILALTWLIRQVILKFVLLTAVIALVAFLVPMAVTYIGGFTGTTGLSGAFASLSPGLWYFLDIFRVPYGLPILISALVARFLIRRIPVIG